MKDVTRTIVQAFVNGKTKRISHTFTDGTGYFLHGHKIAEWRSVTIGNISTGEKIQKQLWITNCGYSTNVTKERLNGLPDVSISQKNFKWFLNGKEWDGSWIMVESY